MIWTVSIDLDTLTKAWKDLVAKKTEPVTLLMMEPAAQPEGPPRPRPPVANIPPSTFADPGASIIDETLTGGAVVLNRPIAVDLPSTACADDSCTLSPAGPTIYPSSSFVFSFATATGTGATSCMFHILTHRPPPTASEDDKPAAASAIIPPEFHRLACLGRRRWGLNGVGVLHLEAVGVVKRALEAVARG